MANIYLSYSRSDVDFALSLALRLKNEGHHIVVDVETLSPGQDWRQTLAKGLKAAEVFIVLLSNSSLRSQNVLLEIGAARAYSAESERMLLVPIAIDEVGVPSIVQDLFILNASDRNLDHIIEQLNKAISQFIGRNAAKDKAAESLAQKIQSNAPSYIDEAIQAQQRAERKNRIFGTSWYIAGFAALVLGIVITGFAITRHSTEPSLVEFAAIALRSIIIIGLLAACSKYAFSLGKSYMSEALKCSDRVHAIAFGKFYLQAYGEKANWSELKEVFQHWNIDRASTFASLDPAQIDPQVITLLGQALTGALNKLGEKRT